MIRQGFALIGSLVAGTMLASPAYAGKKDDAWAQCLWSVAPTSASNWLAMQPVKGDGLESKNPYPLLAVRLQGLCREKMRVPGKDDAPDFKPNAVRAALISSRPTTIGLDVGISDAYRCEIFEENVILGVTVGFGSTSGLRVRPPATSIKCQRVNDDGTLTDA